MKRIYKILICILLVVATFALVSCDDKPQAKQLTDLTLPTLKDNQMAVIIKNGEGDYTSYTVTLSKVGRGEVTVEDVIVYLHEEADLYVDWQNGAYGKFINGIGGAKPASSGEWVTILTSDEEYINLFASYVMIITVGDVTLQSAKVGVSDMTAHAGAVVFFMVAN